MFFDKEKKTISSSTYSVFQNTMVGVLSRGVTFPTEWLYYKYAAQREQSYFQMIKKNIKLATLYELKDIFIKTSLLQTVNKSLSTMGVNGYVEHNYTHLSSLHKGFLTASIGTFAELLLTTKGEWDKVKAFLEKGQVSKKTTLYSIEFGRVFSASFVRIFFTSILTYCSIYQTYESVQKLLPENKKIDPFMKGISAALATFVIQPLNMPFINYQTYAFLHPEKSFRHMTTSFCRQYQYDVVSLFRGSVGRSVNRSAFYGISFFAVEYFKKIEDKSSMTNKKII